MTASAIPGQELARARAALRAASNAWDHVLRGFEEEGLEEALRPIVPPLEEEEESHAEHRDALLARRERIAEAMRENWPEVKPKKRWWRK